MNRAEQLMHQVDMLGYYWRRIAAAELRGEHHAATLWHARLSYERDAIERQLERLTGGYPPS